MTTKNHARPKLYLEFLRICTGTHSVSNIHQRSSDGLSTKTRLFADDTIAYRLVTTSGDCVRLQEDLDRMVEWEKKWGIKFNPDKCEVLQVTTRHKPIAYTYLLKGYFTERSFKTTTSTKYLGVEINSNLNWNSHIKKIAKKANSTLGFVKRNIKTSSRFSRELAYKAIVRPSMMYCSSVWDPHTASLKAKLEGVQRRAARYVCNRYHNTSSVSSMLDELGWNT